MFFFLSFCIGGKFHNNNKSGVGDERVFKHRFNCVNMRHNTEKEGDTEQRLTVA